MTKNTISLLFLSLLTAPLLARDMAQTCKDKGWKLIESKRELYAFCAPPTVKIYRNGIESKRKIKTGHNEYDDAYSLVVYDRAPYWSNPLEEYNILREEGGGGPGYEVQEVLVDKNISKSQDQNLIIKKFVFRGLTDLGGIGAEGPPTPRPVHVGLYLVQNKTSGWTYYIYLEVDTAYLTVQEQKEAWELLHSILSTFAFYDSAPKSPDKKEEPKK